MAWFVCNPSESNRFLSSGSNGFSSESPFGCGVKGWNYSVLCRRRSLILLSPLGWLASTPVLEKVKPWWTCLCTQQLSSVLSVWERLCAVGPLADRTTPSDLLNAEGKPMVFLPLCLLCPDCKCAHLLLLGFVELRRNLHYYTCLVYQNNLEPV